MQSIIEHIIENIEESLDLISTKAGYPVTLTASRRLHLNPQADMKVDITQGEHTPVEQGLHSHQEWIVPVTLEISVITQESYTGSLDTRMNEAAAAALQALDVDPTRGGLADDTVAQGPGQPSEAGITLVVNVQYRHVWGNPYSRG